MSRSEQTRRVLARSDHPEGTYALRRIRSFAGNFLDQLGPAGELSILLTDDQTISALNGTWRKKPRPTDVLSFPSEPDSGLLGDIVISLDTARRQADERDQPLSDELARLLAHGILHLLGHDHEAPDDARRMAAAEVALLGSAGLVSEAIGVRPADLEFKRVAPRACALEHVPQRKRRLRAGAA